MNVLRPRWRHYRPGGGDCGRGGQRAAQVLAVATAEAGEAISELAEDDAADETGSEEPDSTESIDYSSMTVAELKEILKEKGLPVSGKKADLIERLSE